MLQKIISARAICPTFRQQATGNRGRGERGIRHQASDPPVAAHSVRHAVPRTGVKCKMQDAKCKMGRGTRRLLTVNCQLSIVNCPRGTGGDRSRRRVRLCPRSGTIGPLRRRRRSRAPACRCRPPGDRNVSAFSADSPVGCRGTSRRAVLGATSHAFGRLVPALTAGHDRSLRPYKSRYGKRPAVWRAALLYAGYPGLSIGWRGQIPQLGAGPCGRRRQSSSAVRSLSSTLSTTPWMWTISMRQSSVNQQGI